MHEYLQKSNFCFIDDLVYQLTTNNAIKVLNSDLIIINAQCIINTLLMN